MSLVMICAPVERRSRNPAEDDALLDYRERRALQTLEREAVKRHDHAEQYADRNSADMRIRAWEKLHQLRMPSTPLHPVLQVIAAATQLPLAEVQGEQQLRAARRASAEA
jgi:hypothetical protein